MDSGQWTMNASQSSSFKLSYLLTNICVHFLVCFCQQQDAFRIPSNYISMSCLKEYIILVNHHQSIFPPSSPPFAFFFFLNSSLRTQLERWAENLKVNSSLLLKLNSSTASTDYCIILCIPVYHLFRTAIACMHGKLRSRWFRSNWDRFAPLFICQQDTWALCT